MRPVDGLIHEMAQKGGALARTSAIAGEPMLDKSAHLPFMPSLWASSRGKGQTGSPVTSPAAIRLSRRPSLDANMPVTSWPRADDYCAGQGRQVDDGARLDLLAGVGQSVGQNQTPLGVRVVDLDRGAVMPV